MGGSLLNSAYLVPGKYQIDVIPGAMGLDMHMGSRTITPRMRVADVLRKWPETLPVFLSHRMSCIGCFLSPFDTIEEALTVYGLPVAAVLVELNRRIQGDNSHNLGSENERKSDFRSPETGV